MQPAAMQPTAMPLLATISIMHVKRQLGANVLQDQQQFEAWIARHAQPRVSQMQVPPIVPSGPTVSEMVKIYDGDVEVNSVRSGIG